MFKQTINTNKPCQLSVHAGRQEKAAVIVSVLLSGFVWNSVGMAVENILPPTSFLVQHFDGDVDMPDCDLDNLTNISHPLIPPYWKIKSTIGVGSVVHPGREWKVSYEVFKHQWSGQGVDSFVGDNGLDPLHLRIAPIGPVVDSDAPTGTMPKIDDAKSVDGNDPWGLIGPFGKWGYSFDNNSKPPAWPGVGDGSSAKVVITLRATAPGKIEIPKAVASGYDETPPAGNFTCDVPINFFWKVVEPSAPFAKADNANTDARYNNVGMDQTLGPHAVSIDVLANDDDLNIAGGPGDLSQVRIQDWDAASVQGGTVYCGTAQQKDAPASTAFADLATGPCIYTPPMIYTGTDSFTYKLRTVSDANVLSTAKVTINIKGNQSPYVGAVGFGTTPGVDSTFDMAPFISDSQGDSFSCSANGAVSPAGVGTATVNSDCTLTWDNTNAGYTGNVTVPFRACDAHPTLVNGQLGANVVRAANYANADWNATHTRRCRASNATISILAGLIIPPTGVGDKDVVDAGYTSDGVGSYTLRIPVLDNDTDGNGPDPTMPSAGLAVLTPPAANEGVASIDGDRLVFTPADGFSGFTSMTYRVCEDPAQQSPPYFDDPNTPLVDEGAAFCGVGVVTVEVLGNAAPVVATDITAIADDDVLLGYDLGINDTDPDGDAMGCTAGTPVASNPGLVESASVSADCKLDFDPVNGQVGVVEFTYEVCDQHVLATPAYPAVPYGTDGLSPGDTSSRCSTGIAKITVSVAQPPEPKPEDSDPDPVCTADVVVTGLNQTVAISVLDNDSDLNQQFQSSPVILTGPPADQPEVTMNGGVAKMNGANTILYTPPADFQGVDDFSYTARDSIGQACKANVHITISAALGGDPIGVPTLTTAAKWLLMLLLGVTALVVIRRY